MTDAEAILKLIEEGDEDVDLATPGPWVVNGFGGDFAVLARTRAGVAISSSAMPFSGDIEDARFIAHARTAYPAALAALRVLVASINSSCTVCRAEDALARARAALEAE